MRRLTNSAIAAACLFAMAAPLQAQAPGIDIRLNPRIGVYTPLTDLGEIQVNGTTVNPEMAGSLALGLGLELDLRLPVNVRLNLDYATGSEIRSTGVGVDFAPFETTLLAVVGDLVWRPLPRGVLWQPYLFGGGGLKQYDVTDATVATFEAESDPTIHIGGGLEFGLGPFGLNAEVGDYISWYELQENTDSEMQHDIFVTVGFSIGIL